MRAIIAIGLVGCGFQGPELQATPISVDAPPGHVAIDAALPVSGLIAWYEMETVPPAIDSTGKGHTGTCTSCPDLVEGKRGMGYRFHQSSDRLDVAQASDLMTTSGFTAAVWLSADSLPDQGAYACPFNRNYGNQLSNAWQLCLYGASSSNQAWVFNTAGPGAALVLPSTIGKGEWHHLAITWDGQTKQLWLDGASVASEPMTMVLFDANVTTIGADVANGLQQDAPFAGVLDDARIYDRALGAAEIMALAQ